MTEKFKHSRRREDDQETAARKVGELLISGQAAAAGEEEVRERQQRAAGSFLLSAAGESSTEDTVLGRASVMSEIVNEERILQLLGSAERSKSLQDIVDELNEGAARRVDSKSVGKDLSAMRRQAKIQLLPGGLYCSSEHQDGMRETQPTLERRIGAIFKEAERPMAAREIIGFLNEDGFKKVRPASVRSLLAGMCKQAKIKRWANGIYSDLELVDYEYRILPTIKHRITEALSDSEQPMFVHEVVDRLNGDGFGEVKPSTVKTALSHMQAKAEVQRLALGLYAELGYAVHDYRIPLTIKQRVRAILENSRRPMYVREIIDGLNDDGFEKANPVSIRCSLVSLCDASEIQRLAIGIYCIPGFADDWQGIIPKTERGRVEIQRSEIITESDSSPDKAAHATASFIEESILRILTDAEESLSAEDILARLATNFAHMDSENILNQLSDLCRLGKLCYDEDEKCYSPKDNSRQRDAPTKITVSKRITKIIVALEEPISVQAVAEGLSNDGWGEVDLETIQFMTEIICMRKQLWME